MGDTRSSIRHFSNAELTIYFKSILIGFLLTAAALFGGQVGLRLLAETPASHTDFVIFVSSCFLAFVLLPMVLGARISLFKMRRIFLSKRFDLLFFLTVGVVIAIIFNSKLASIYKWIHTYLDDETVFLLILCMISVEVVFVLKTFARTKTENIEDRATFFVDDTAKGSVEQDVLEFREKSKRFAEVVFNQKSSDSFIFGLDAPWGTGKSTFVNFCIQEWRERYPNQTIVYKFNPLQYGESRDLQEKLIDGLVQSIQREVFIPELRSLAEHYMRFSTAQKGINWGGVKLQFGAPSSPIEEAHKDLEDALRALDKKVIVIIDDLDRLPFDIMKSVLYSIREGFFLPNVSYVLCYDTENILLNKNDNVEAQHVGEFLEKFVNIKFNLLLAPHVIQNFIANNIKDLLGKNSLVDPAFISQVIQGLRDLYDENCYIKYAPLIGDLRKLKRLLNTIILLGLDQAKLKNSDIDPHDLIHLLLLYLNFPKVFRAIYNSETNGKRGLFSVISRHEAAFEAMGDGEEFRNSKCYDKYTKTLDCLPRFLLDQVFKVSVRLQPILDQSGDNISEENKAKLACFNRGDWGQDNLERYLNLIVNLRQPPEASQLQFYLSLFKDIQKHRPIEDIFNTSEFSRSNSERVHMKLWRTIVNKSRDLEFDIGQALIDKLLDSFPQYSVIDIDRLGTGGRLDLALLLVRILDAIGWSDQQRQYIDNIEGNVSAIAERIYGEGQYENNGLLSKLFHADRGVLGLYDVMRFRLYCCADRGGDVFNVQRSLILHHDPNGQTSGSVQAIVVGEMRELSQSIFSRFKNDFINKRVNIFTLVESLSLKELASEWEGFIKEKVNDDEPVSDEHISTEELEQIIAQTKSRIIVFILYQLGNQLIKSGIGCGYYDEKGIEDRNGIADQVSRYLFDVCFSIEQSGQNAVYFMDYILMNCATPFETDGAAQPILEKILLVVNVADLREYWLKNRDFFIKQKFGKKVRLIQTGNYEISYTDGVPNVILLLDQLVRTKEVDNEDE